MFACLPSVADCTLPPPPPPSDHTHSSVLMSFLALISCTRNTEGPLALACPSLCWCRAYLMQSRIICIEEAPAAEEARQALYVLLQTTFLRYRKCVRGSARAGGRARAPAEGSSRGTGGSCCPVDGADPAKKNAHAHSHRRRYTRPDQQTRACTRTLRPTVSLLLMGRVAALGGGACPP